MKKGFLLQEIQCKACGLGAKLTPPTVLGSEQDVINAASSVHKSSKIICAKPMMIILYSPVLVSNELEITKPDFGKVPQMNDVATPAGKVVPMPTLDQILKRNGKASTNKSV